MQVFNYNIKIDDLIELGVYRLRSNPQVRLQTRVLNLVVPIVIFLGSMGTVYLLDSDKQLTLIDWIVPCVLVVFMIFLFPRTFDSNIRKRIAAQLKEAPEKDMVGKYTAKVMPELIVQTFKGQEIRAPWTAVSQVGSTDQHIFILVDETQGIVIPRAGLASAEQFDQLKSLVLQHRRL
jgi:hypothetical protein